MFPASAGINRATLDNCLDSCRVPRVSGDKPPAPRLVASNEKCSPRQRG
ncbi:TPA: hypothetical protein HI015_001657 [Escherichia coli]|uniref:Uncharacterized protein n=1 Tax=Escherichia coli TaxID=562 RepID=A0A797HWS8_ECOLX|nr:hypothetical protein [Escherichia coli]EFY9118782.1 hypothetical protein [Shigella flexneri]OSL82572.1 hypothetical protein EAZG_02797 [Escherichia coli TA249]EFB4496464.1 hypothetical protein [Escherichia coli]EFE3095400.1 hypothetical protein [Escherichia coli]